MLSFEGWFDGISAIVIFLFGIGYGIYQIKYSKTYKIKLLFYFGLSTIFIGMNYIQTMVDLPTILIYGRNFDALNYTIEPFNSSPLLCLLSYMWVAPTIYSASIIAGELIIPKQKRYITLTILILGILYELFIFLGPNSYVVHVYPAIEGEDLIDGYLIPGSPPSLISILFLLFLWVFFVVGAIFRGFQTKGAIRRKFFYIALGVFLLSLSLIFESLSYPGFLIIIDRSLMIIGLLLINFGLRPQKRKERKRKIPSEEVVKLASYMGGKAGADSSDKSLSVLSENLEEELLLFVSYATKDVDTFKVHNIAQKLKEFPEIENVLYWEEHMEDNIFEYMDENLSKCDVMILFCSEKALESVPVKKEWTAAEALGKPIIPVFYNPHHIPALLSSRLGVQFDFYDTERNVQDLRNLILKKVGGLTE